MQDAKTGSEDAALSLPQHIADISPHNFVPVDCDLDDRPANGAANPEQSIPEQTLLQVGSPKESASPRLRQAKRLRESDSSAGAREEAGGIIFDLQVSSGKHLGGLGSQGSDDSSHSLHQPSDHAAEDGEPQQKRRSLRSRTSASQEEPQGQLCGAASPLTERPLSCNGAGSGEACAAAGGGACHPAGVSISDIPTTDQAKEGKGLLFPIPYR